MIELEEKATPVIVDINSGDITANIDNGNKIETSLGTIAQMDGTAAVHYIKSGSAEIAAAVREGATAFDLNALNKTAAYNQNADDKLQDFNNNAADKTALIDVKVNTARDWATKTDGSVDGTEYSAKYYAEQTEVVIAGAADKDLSNLSATGEAKFDAKQDVISDLADIRSGAAAGATAVQPASLSAYALSADLATVATSGAYSDLSGTPNMANYVTLDTNQTISGSKTFTNNLIHNKTDIAYTETPATNKYGGFNFLDKNGSEISAFYTGLYTSGDGLAGFNLKNKSGNTAELYLSYNANGDFYTRAPTPTETTTTTGTQIATTGWVNSTNNNVVHKTGTETISGNKTFTGDKVFVGGYANVIIKNSTNNDSDYSDIEFDKANGTRIGNIRVYNDGFATMAMFTTIALSAIYPYNDNSYKLGDSSQRWKQLYAGTATINTSDERVKQQIEFIPDEVLDAWGEVNFYQYKFNDAVEEKGEKARLHTGMIAQRIENTFKAHNLDAFKYGLLCYDEWEARKEEIDKNGEISRPGREAGNRYSLRYEECLCMEAAYQRRRAERIEARLAALEARL